MLQGGSFGFINNTSGLFYNPVCAELGFSMGAFTLHKTILGVASVVALMFVSSLLERYGARAVLSLAAAVLGISTVLMGFASQLWQFYALGALQGLSSAFLMYATAPIILTNWFHERTGTVIGLASASSGLIGALANQLGSAVIQAGSWRDGYFFCGVGLLAIALPATLFILKLRPSDCGLEPYGMKRGESAETARGGMTLEQARRCPSFYMMIASGLLMSFASGLVFHFVPYGTSLGFPAASAALIGTIAMLGNSGTKLLLGPVGDRLGPKKTGIVSSIIPLVGFLMMLTGLSVVTHVGALLTAFTMAVNTVVFPTVCRALFGVRDYARIYPFVSTGVSLMASASITIFGVLYDLSGGYSASFWTTVGALVVCIALFAAMFYCNKRERKSLLDGAA